MAAPIQIAAYFAGNTAQRTSFTLGMIIAVPDPLSSRDYPFPSRTRRLANCSSSTPMSASIESQH